MVRVRKPEPGRLVISTISSSVDAVAECLDVLERRFGSVQYETGEIVCSNAQQYHEEMGSSPVRRFFSFEQPVSRSALPEIKAICHKIEPRFADKLGDFLFRTVNIDPGIITPENLVIASHRGLGHQVYLGEGVFAEIVLMYARRRFVRLPWTNPDFCHPDVIDFLERVRTAFELVEETSR